MEKKRFNMVFLPEGAVVVTKAEMEALNTYSEKVRRETVKAIFTDFAELLEARCKIEDNWASHCENADDRGNYLYGRGLCEMLLIDLQKIERKYEE